MIPIKGKKYLIDYRPSTTTDSSSEYKYVGVATYTGEEEQINDESLYIFQELQEEFGYTNTALFSEEDIVEEII